MRRRTFLTRIAAALTAIAAAPVVSDALHWKDGAGLYRGATKVYQSPLYDLNAVEMNRRFTRLAIEMERMILHYESSDNGKTWTRAK